jgi:hypothetical protein
MPAAVVALAGAAAPGAETERAAEEMLCGLCATHCFAVCWPERMRRFPAEECRAAAEQ